MSLSLSLINSIGLSPVSFEMEMAVLSFGEAFAIMQFILASCGIFGILRLGMYFGLSHVKPYVLTYLSYANTSCFLYPCVLSRVAKNDFIVSGSFRLQCFANVSSDLP